MGESGAVAIVTGGASGLGLEIARRLAQDGATVVIADIRGSRVAADALAGDGLQALGIDTDVADWGSVQSMAEETLARFGRIDALVNNAAIASAMALTPFEQIDSEMFMQMIAVNTLGTFNGCKAVSPAMRAQKSGSIINLASGTALRGMPYITPYVASKGAIIAMTRSLAHELGNDGITVNAVSPGYTLTRSNVENTAYMETVRPSVLALRALKRDALPDDIVGTVAFLASRDARFITGQILAVDGGATYQ